MIRRPFLTAAPILAAFLFALMSSAASACAGRVHIETKGTAIYAIDRAAIVAAQPSLADCGSDDLYLLNRGSEVPIRIVAAHDVLQDGDRVEWFGQALHGPQTWYDQYSAVNVYQLGAKSGAHARMREIAAANAANTPTPLQRTLHMEQENLMLRISDAEMRPGEEPDVWQWAKLTPIDPKPFDYDFDLPDLDLHAAKTPVGFTFAFRGMSNVPAKPKQEKPVDHLVQISINGKALPAMSWDGRSDFRKPLQIPVASLQTKGNRLSIRVVHRDLPGDPTSFIVDVVMFNWFDVTYPVQNTPAEHSTAFAVSADGTARLAGDVYGSDGTFQHGTLAQLTHGVDYFAVATSELRVPTATRAVARVDVRNDTDGFDYIMVAHPRLLPAIQPLAQYHRDHGLKVAVYDVDDLYDEFNAGIAHPSAIRDLIAWGNAHWQTKPRYVLLVGDASFDIHHDQRLNKSAANQYAIRTGLQRDELLAQGGLSAMSTTRYAQWDDQLPNRNLIPTWQFPTAEGQSATDNPFVAIKPGDFHPQLAIGRLPVVEPSEVAAIVKKTIAYLDKPATGDWRRDVTLVSTSEVPSFKGESDKIAKNLQDRGFSVNNVYTDFNEKDASRYTQVRKTLKDDLDPGNLLVHFIGHGGQFIWRVGPIGDLFTLDDVSSLKNAGRYPMVLAMTCFSAPFDHPTEDSIGERFLREADKGAVAVFAASWSNWPNPQNSSTLIDALLQPGVAIGDAIVAVKAKTEDRTLVEMYNLLGDPAVVLAQPRGKLQFMRNDDRWNPQALVKIDAPSFGGNVDLDWIDAHGIVLQAKKYQLRDTQFALPIPRGATQIRVYAEDSRNGRSWFGSADVRERPKPVAPPIAANLAPIRPHVPHVKTADTVMFSDFDADAAAPPKPVSPPHD